jgi:recombination protein RecA
MALRIPTKKEYEAVLKRLQEECGNGISNIEDSHTDPKGIPTGYDDLDSILTKGASGLYKGGIVEIAGPEGSGKSSLALRVVGSAQKLGMKCAWIDAESGLDYNLAKLNGVDTTSLLYPELADTKALNKEEEGSLAILNVGNVLEIMYKLIVSNIIDVVVLDSVAGLMPESILADDFDPNKTGVSEIARVISRIIPKIAMACKKTETLAIFINQLRDQPGAYIQNRYHTPGGRALKFFAHQRLCVEKIGGEAGRIYSSEKDLIGHYAKCTIVKNKKAPPVPLDVNIQIPIYYREYFPDDAKKCYDLARKLLVITIRNGTLTWKDKNGNVILQKDGESEILDEIRSKSLVNQLAHYCVIASSNEKNKGMKLSNNIIELAKQYNEAYGSSAISEPDDAKKRRKPALANEEI